MKKVLFILVAGMLLPFFSHAQVHKLMSAYEGKEGVTITHLDKNLYGLYKKKNLSPAAEKLLKDLNEVNILSFDLARNTTWTADGITGKFTDELKKKGYTLVKSATTNDSKQFIYSKNAEDKLSDLVVINQETKNNLEIIELRGNIQAENIALLSRALNIKGLNSLSALNPNNEKYTSYLQSFNYNTMSSEEVKKQAEEMRKQAEIMRKKAEEMRRNFNMGTNFNFSFSGDDSTFFNNFRLGTMDSIFNTIGSGFSTMGSFFDQLGSNIGDFGNTISTMGSSIQITEDNGKTKIKINTKNLDIIYIVDGIKFEGEEITMPEQIKYVNLVNDKKDSRKSYLIVTSDIRLGDFISLKDNTLRFKYDNQDFKYNLAKSDKPLLWLNGAAAADFSGVDIANIRQIRPITQAEKETGYYKSAEVFITTK